MTYSITGKVYEKESGRALPGLHVRAYDKDLFFDDLLGTAVTDKDGKFHIEYQKKDFSELFEQKPDIYFSVFTATFRHVMDTKDSIRWNASEEEKVEIAIARKDLRDEGPETANDRIDASLKVDKQHFKLLHVDGYQRPHLPGFAPAGLPGEPALLSQFQYLVMPRGAELLELEVDPGEPVVIEGVERPMAVQEPYPDLGTNPKEFSDGLTWQDIPPTFTPLREEFLKSDQPFPRELAQIEKQEDFGYVQLVSVKVTPVQYQASTNSYLFYPDLKYQAKLKEPPASKQREKQQAQTGMGYAEAEILDQLLTMDLAFPARDLRLPGWVIWEEAQHVIITDNYAWPDSIDRGDGTTRAPDLSERGAALSGDMIAEFDRLAQWKTAKGVRSKLVTVSQIVDGTFGDMTHGGFARDLQEVIRNFVKFAKQQWKTSYFLMAGDVNVVPIRKLCGCSLYSTIGVSNTVSNPPAQYQCTHLSGKNTSKLHPGFTPQPNDPLAALNSGLRIPFDREAGAGRLGWYYTSESDFNSKDDGFTRLPTGQTSRYIIVEGPDTDINDSFYWYRDVNAIPSDFYYSSLIGPGYSQPGNHDFDLNNNGLYGQFYWDGTGDHSLDGVDWAVDVFVGRASVETGTQAQAFVDKVIGYEKLETSAGEAIDINYLRKIIYSAALWGSWHTHTRQANTATVPAEGSFTHVDGSTETHLHLNFDVGLSGGVPTHRCLGQSGSTDTTINYNTGANATIPGWYFCTDDSYATQSATATRFVCIRGPEGSINKDHFSWDVMGLELSAAEKEDLRGRMNSWFPAFDNVQRHYADYFDLTMPPQLDKLVSDDLKEAIDEGCHFLSLTGHGWSGGCCGINTSTQDFANNHQFFIAFADSCSTARIDSNDSAAEVLTNDINGGALAYVGNSRYSWIGVGDNFERFFWAKLSVSGRVGIAAGLRASSGGARWPWVIYAQNLFGDPEMPVYTSLPQILQVSHPESIRWGGKLSVNVKTGGDNLSNARVTIMAGWKGGQQKPLLLETKFSNSFGNVGFKLPAAPAKAPRLLQITVTKPNVKAYSTTIQLQKAREKLTDKMVDE